MDPLLIQACGPCLPPGRSSAAFLALITDKYRNFTQDYQRHWVGMDQKGSKSQQHNNTSSAGFDSASVSTMENIPSTIR